MLTKAELITVLEPLYASLGDQWSSVGGNRYSVSGKIEKKDLPLAYACDGLQSALEQLTLDSNCVLWDTWLSVGPELIPEEIQVAIRYYCVVSHSNGLPEV